MELILKERLAIILCAADVSCSYISVNPILENRDELITKQQIIYKTLLDSIEQTLTPDFVDIEHRVLDQLWHGAIELTAADIICEAISLAPVLYDRIDKVGERIIFNFNRLKNCFPLNHQEAAQKKMMSTENQDAAFQVHGNNKEWGGEVTKKKHPLQTKANIRNKKHKRNKR